MSRPVATGHDNEEYTVSVAEAAELFTGAGLPRTERAVQSFCKRGDLICAFVDTPFGSKYLIKRSSIERLIQQKLQAQTFSPDQADHGVSRPDATGRDQSRHEPDATERFAAEKVSIDRHDPLNEGHDNEQRQAATLDAELASKLKKVEEENLNLKIDNKAKEQFINYLVSERKQMSDSMQDMSYRLGAAETRVQQLEAPKEPRQGSDTGDDMPRPVAIEVPEPATSVVEPSVPEPAPTTPERKPEAKKSWWPW